MVWPEGTLLRLTRTHRSRTMGRSVGTPPSGPPPSTSRVPSSPAPTVGSAVGSSVSLTLAMMESICVVGGGVGITGAGVGEGVAGARVGRSVGRRVGGGVGGLIGFGVGGLASHQGLSPVGSSVTRSGLVASGVGPGVGSSVVCGSGGGCCSPASTSSTTSSSNSSMIIWSTLSITVADMVGSGVSVPVGSSVVSGPPIWRGWPTTSRSSSVLVAVAVTVGSAVGTGVGSSVGRGVGSPS
mmetsp:Transcript_8918/g.14722  ORF Transcript_8918/g.14722 Transcript_8918/m.14722 type:complete len:240 (-) Transcript_8918:515-1234(-)